ncbi:expressed unknown protein [Seminavis robusta]|uniref:Uncharacterized protein n=1 Tax=Seminavis robusta TaxID=568900 RepID=A0A9N8E141_9STRA|nr:expressed unknown protein [Seminavis robusta]|eukprot:Sro403_g135630.1 n/a (1071) ;mRNA; f:23085-26297
MARTQKGRRRRRKPSSKVNYEIIDKYYDREKDEIIFEDYVMWVKRSWIRYEGFDDQDSMWQFMRDCGECALGKFHGTSSWQEVDYNCPDIININHSSSTEYPHINLRNQVFDFLWLSLDTTTQKFTYDLLDEYFLFKSHNDKKLFPDSMLAMIFGNVIRRDTETFRVQLTKKQQILLEHEGIVSLKQDKDEITFHRPHAVKQNKLFEMVFSIFEDDDVSEDRDETKDWTIPTDHSSTGPLLAALLAVKLLQFVPNNHLLSVILSIYAMQYEPPKDEDDDDDDKYENMFFDHARPVYLEHYCLEEQKEFDDDTLWQHAGEALLVLKCRNKVCVRELEDENNDDCSVDSESESTASSTDCEDDNQTEATSTQGNLASSPNHDAEKKTKPLVSPPPGDTHTPATNEAGTNEQSAAAAVAEEYQQRMKAAELRVQDMVQNSLAELTEKEKKQQAEATDLENRRQQQDARSKHLAAGWKELRAERGKHVELQKREMASRLEEESKLNAAKEKLKEDQLKLQKERTAQESKLKAANEKLKEDQLKLQNERTAHATEQKEVLAKQDEKWKSLDDGWKEQLAEKGRQMEVQQRETNSRLEKERVLKAAQEQLKRDQQKLKEEQRKLQENWRKVKTELAKVTAEPVRLMGELEVREADLAEERRYLDGEMSNLKIGRSNLHDKEKELEQRETTFRLEKDKELTAAQEQLKLDRLKLEEGQQKLEVERATQKAEHERELAKLQAQWTDFAEKKGQLDEDQRKLNDQRNNLQAEKARQEELQEEEKNAQKELEAECATQKAEHEKELAKLEAQLADLAEKRRLQDEEKKKAEMKEDERARKAEREANKREREVTKRDEEVKKREEKVKQLEKQLNDGWQSMEKERAEQSKKGKRLEEDRAKLRKDQIELEAKKQRLENDAKKLEQKKEERAREKAEREAKREEKRAQKERRRQQKEQLKQEKALAKEDRKKQKAQKEQHEAQAKGKEAEAEAKTTQEQDEQRQKPREETIHNQEHVHREVHVNQDDIIQDDEPQPQEARGKASSALSQVPGSGKKKGTKKRKAATPIRPGCAISDKRIKNH